MVINSRRTPTTPAIVVCHKIVVPEIEIERDSLLYIIICFSRREMCLSS